MFVRYTRVEVLSISISEGRARVKSPVYRLCYRGIPTIIKPNLPEANLGYSPFWLSSNANKFMVIGSGGLGGLGLITGTMSKIKSGCMAWEVFDQEILVDSLCSGIGCCENIIPYPSKYFQIYFYENSLPASVFNTCRYAMLVEANNIFKFRTSYLISPESFEKDAISLLAVLDWTISNDTCNIAQQNMTSYACVSSHSKCIDYNNLGYHCSCVQGYQGNPYVPSGCQDIDECLNLNCFGICTNTPGSFKCECPPGTHGNGSISGGCYKNGPKIQLWGKMVIGFSIFIVVLLLSSFLVYSVYQRRKVAAIKRKYFQQYGGQLFLEEMKSKHGVSFRICKEEELIEATNNFDEKNKVAGGGNGIVYRGTMDNKLVAIKKCKTIGERERKEFGKEILILSQLNHKNIVAILGCCLEVEIPILIYEFISDGTLFDLLHRKCDVHIPLRIRLKIAQETAEALSYLHSWASPIIVHRDVKASNILLDENFVVKVSDFGASVPTPCGEDEFLTHVQGTRGYLDPEYVQTGQLTVRSDVYSFGVVLLELLTRKMAFYTDGLQVRSLVAVFYSAIKENNVVAILDDDITGDEESMDVIPELVEIVRKCLYMEGERRPEMRQVAAAIEASSKSYEKSATQREIGLI
ncbi:Wall-associated kinase family protein [Rhynchospora pubera]|nr:Wall-associated kinase family protein [Rhynchospora pubera]